MTLSATIHPLAPAIEAATLYFQIAGVSATDGIAAGGGTAVTLLDASF